MDVFELLLIVIFFSLSNFWLPMHSLSVLHDCAVSNSAKGGVVKSKKCSLFMINDQNFFMYIIRFSGNFCRVFSKTRLLFSNLSFIH